MKKEYTEEKLIINEITDNTEDTLRDEYDESVFARAIQNPIAGRIKKQITIRIDTETIDYFKKQSEETGIPYQTLINYCLSDYVKNKRVPKIVFE